MVKLLNEKGVVHLRFKGRSHDLRLDELGVAYRSSDGEIKQALARHLETPQDALRDHFIDRHLTGNLTVRPRAVFG